MGRTVAFLPERLVILTCLVFSLASSTSTMPHLCGSGSIRDLASRPKRTSNRSTWPEGSRTSLIRTLWSWRLRAAAMRALSASLNAIAFP